MSSRQARLGVLVPSVNTTVEAEFNLMAPEWCTIHASRVMFPRGRRDRYRVFLADIPTETKKLAHASVKGIALACTMGGLYEGHGSDVKITDLIQKLSGVPSTTTISSVLAALRKLHIRRLSVMTPYGEMENRKEKKFLEESGIEVISICTMDRKGLLIPNVPSGLVYENAIAMGCSGSDGMFISCTGLATVEVLNLLERKFGKPVISSNQATFWNLLRITKTRFASSTRFGSLMEE